MWDTKWHQQNDGTIIGKFDDPMEGEEFWYHALEKVEDQPNDRIAIALGSLPNCDNYGNTLLNPKFNENHALHASHASPPDGDTQSFDKLRTDGHFPGGSRALAFANHRNRDGR